MSGCFWAYLRPSDLTYLSWRQWAAVRSGRAGPPRVVRSWVTHLLLTGPGPGPPRRTQSGIANRPIEPKLAVTTPVGIVSGRQGGAGCCSEGWRTAKNRAADILGCELEYGTVPAACRPQMALLFVLTVALLCKTD